MSVDLHRHSEYSFFDGFGKAKELAELAKSYGYTSLGMSEHGNTNGLIQHYTACNEVGIKPILGIEAYFKPKVNEKRESHHLCLFVKNFEGYCNLNRLLYEAEKQKYYVPIVTFDLLEKYHEGIICSTACVASYFSKMILKGKIDKAKNALQKFKNVFDEDLYIEIQPYKIDDDGTQEKVNIELMKLSKELKIKCILTSDSHYGSKKDFDTYKKMHEIAKHAYDIDKTYGERYMPTPEEIKRRFIKLHKNDCKDAEKVANKYERNIEELESKVEENILEELTMSLPKFSDDSYKLIKKKVINRLKELGKYNEEYIERCKQELKVIKHHGFEDYFLIVADYVNWAKQQGITVGPGRGSVCNSEIAYLLGITEVDSLLFNLDFRRFLRMDKKKMPDIDLDFETSRRGEVINYLINKYKNQSAQICSYGLYRVDNLVNDLSKVCGLDITDKEITKEEKEERKKIIKSIKSLVNKYIIDDIFDFEGFLKDKKTLKFNMKYDNICKHFTKLYKKIRFIGTHAAGVAITGSNLLNYTTFRRNKEGNIFTNYDLSDLESINVIKFDILGLKTMEELGELRRMTGNTGFKEEWLNDKKMMKEFRNGNTVGVFQFDKPGVQDMLRNIKCDCFEDVVAASSMNRPGPLSLNMPEQYANNKFNIDEAKKAEYYKYTKETYGTIIYQEQLQQICVNIGDLSWEEADKVMKMLKGKEQTEAHLKIVEQEKKKLTEKFAEGAMKKGISKNKAKEMFENLLVYSFNKGHAVGYTLISIEEMYYKIYYPIEFWACKLKSESTDIKRIEYKSYAVKDGCVIMLPHVNGTIYDEISELDGDKVIQEGLATIKNVGEKAAKEIIEMGPYIDFPDFEEKLMELPKERKRCINKRVIQTLKDFGAFDFNEKNYHRRIVSYNSSLYSKTFNSTW